MKPISTFGRKNKGWELRSFVRKRNIGSSFQEREYRDRFGFRSTEGIDNSQSIEKVGIGFRYRQTHHISRGKTLCIVFIAQIEWVAKIGFLIGNDLETSEVLYSALLNPKNADFKCKGSGLVWIIIILVL